MVCHPLPLVADWFMYPYVVANPGITPVWSQWRAPGISVFTALTVRPFRFLRYGELEEFANCLLESDAMASSISMVLDSDSDYPIIPVGYVYPLILVGYVI